MRDFGKIAFIVLGLVFAVLAASWTTILQSLLFKDIAAYPFQDADATVRLAEWISQSTFRILAARAVLAAAAFACFAAVCMMDPKEEIQA